MNIACSPKHILLSYNLCKIIPKIVFLAPEERNINPGVSLGVRKRWRQP